MIQNVIIDDDKVVVRLVDTGDVVVVSSEDIRECPEMFLLSPGLAFYCHLEGVYTVDGVITEVELDQIRSSVPAGPVDLARRGPVVRKKYSDEDVDHEMFSLPVEISWSKDESSDPFQPNEVSHFSLTEICLSHMKIGTDINDNLMELNDLKNYLPDNNEFDHVQSMPKSESFKWLPPELPDKATFSARGTNVDQSGQIYIQPSPRRQTVRALKRLLNEKFLDSPPDEHQTLLEEGQSCCVRWTDGSWYRARFLEYINDKRDRAHVFLVDFGNLYIANVITEIRRDIFAERVPIQAITVELADVAPAGSNGTWHHDALNMMQVLFYLFYNLPYSLFVSFIFRNVLITNVSKTKATSYT